MSVLSRERTFIRVTASAWCQHATFKKPPTEAPSYVTLLSLLPGIPAVGLACGALICCFGWLSGTAARCAIATAARASDSSYATARTTRNSAAGFCPAAATMRSLEFDFSAFDCCHPAAPLPPPPPPMRSLCAVCIGLCLRTKDLRPRGPLHGTASLPPPVESGDAIGSGSMRPSCGATGPTQLQATKKINRPTVFEIECPFGSKNEPAFAGARCARSGASGADGVTR